MDVSGMTSRRLLGVILLLVFVFLNSCTRAANDTSQVKLVFPTSQNQSSQASSTVEIPVHISVNISAPDMTTVFWAWDSHGNNATSSAPPGVSITVNQGLARLIQVLYVTQDASQNLYFYYNDVTQDLAAASVPVAIDVNAIGTANSQGRIVGRYLNAAGSGPTGILSTYFTPGTGKPQMILDQNEIFGGWFSAFSLPGQSFTYKADDGTVILSNYQPASSFTSGMASALVSVPAGYRINSGGGNSNYNSAEYILAGFFGPGSSSKKVCFNPAASLVIPHLFLDAAGSSPINWNGSLSACAANQACLVAGGTNSDSSCSTIDNVSNLKFDESLLSSNDQIMLFRGPFQLTNSGSGNAQQITGSLSGSTLTLGWQFMPGASAGIDGVEAFYKWDTPSTGSPPYQINNGYACENLVSSFGFTSGGQVAVAHNSTSFNVGSAPVAGQSLITLLCPYSNSRRPIYFHSAAQWFNNSSTSNLQFALVDSGGGSNNTGSVSSCKSFNLKLLTPAGAAYTTPSAFSANLSVNANSSSMAGSGFSLSAGCSSPSPNLTYSFASGQSVATIYFVGTANDYYNIMVQSPGYYPMNLDFGVAQSVPTSIVVNSSNAMANGQCYAFEVKLQNGSYKPAIAVEAFTLALAGGLAGSFYSDNFCASTALNISSSISIPTGSHGMTLYFKPNVSSLVSSGAIGFGSVVPTLSSSAQIISADVAVQPTGSGATAYGVSAYAMGGPGYDPGQCMPLYVYGVNSVGAPINPTTDQVVHLNSLGGGQVFTDTCGGTNLGAGTYAIHANNPGQPLWLMPSAASVSLQFTDASGRISNNLSINVNPPTKFQWTGVIANMGTGMCYPATLQALNSQGSPYNFLSAQNFSYTGSENFFTDSACTTSSSFIPFVAGNSSTANLYVKFLTAGAASLNIPAAVNPTVIFSGLNIFQSFLTPNSPIAGCSTAPGASLIFTLKANAVIIPGAYVPSLSFAGLTLNLGTYTPKFCASTATAYGSCTATAVLNMGAGQSTSSATPLFIKDSAQVADSFVVGGSTLPPGVQISGNTAVCN